MDMAEMHENLQEKLERICREVVAKEKLFFFALRLRNAQSRQPIIELTVDSEGGITIDRCSELSRLLRDRIDSEDLISDNYRLDVSSPGLGVPLTHDFQLQRAVGRKVRLEIANEPEKAKGKYVEGQFVAYDETYFTLKNDKKDTENKIRRDSVVAISELPQW
jgi:ribosome maturation factor RimP